jgi:PGF-pre-PGF domain-containing protein
MYQPFRQNGIRMKSRSQVILLFLIPLLILGFTGPASAADRFNNTARWSSFNLATVNSTLKGFNGGLAAGGYVYFVPWYNGAAYSGSTARYDTTKPFTDAASWEYFNMTRVNGTLKGFTTAAVSGSHVYYAPWDAGASHGNSVRYDTTGPFTEPGSWEYFNITRVNSTLKGFGGVVASGNYVYYIPYSNGHSNGDMVRYDTSRSYTDPASWEYFNVSRVNPAAAGFWGATVSGTYLYLCPSYNDAGASGDSVRYDTTETFTDPASWEYFDISAVNADLKGFAGDVSAGQYVYYIPWSTDADYSGVTARYDITKPYTDPASWEAFDIATVNTTLVGFWGGDASGNYVYYSPNGNSIAYSGNAARYDITGPFTSAASWESFNMTPMNPLMKGFTGVIVSGDSIYFIPFGGTYNGVVGRYNATPAPVASFTANPAAGAPPLPVTFTDSSTGSPTSWNWSFGDGNVSAVQNPGHTYVSTGTYSVNLTVTRIGESDCLVRTDYITVSPPPSANFTATPISGTAPLSVLFTDVSTGTITTYAWDFGDGNTSTLQSPSHTYDVTGIFTVNLTATGPGGSDSEEKVDYITVNLPPPTANFTATPVAGTTPLSVQFTGTSTGTITAYSWDFGDGSTSTLQNPSHSYSAAGMYSVNLTVTGPGGSDSEVKTGYITASAPPSHQTGSSGSGSSTAPSFAGSHSDLKAGVETTLSYPKDSTVQSIVFIPPKDIPNILVLVTEDVPLPPGLPAPTGSVLDTFGCTLYHAQPGDLGPVTIRFRIPASKLVGTGLSPGDVVLMRAGGAGWEELPTEYLGESEGFLSYQATSPGLSTFAIVGMPGRAATLTATTETTSEVTLTTTIPTTTVRTTHTTLPGTSLTMPDATPIKATPVSWAALLIALAIAVLFRNE